MFAILFNTLKNKKANNKEQPENMAIAVIRVSAVPGPKPTRRKFDTTLTENEVIAHAFVALDKGIPIVRAQVSASC